MDSAMVWAPIKTEILYPDPMVVQFYDIISDDESEQIRTFATRQLKRSVTPVSESWVRNPGLSLISFLEQQSGIHRQAC